MTLREITDDSKCGMQNLSVLLLFEPYTEIGAGSLQRFFSINLLIVWSDFSLGRQSNSSAAAFPAF